MHDDEIVSTATGSIMRSIRNNSLILGLFALACTGFIAATFIGTEKNIAAQIREARLKALLEIIPRSEHDNDLLADSIELNINELGHRTKEKLFLAKKNQQPLAIIYPVTARDGYSGDINFIIGIHLDGGTIAGVRVLNHRETPGLGDKIELRKSSWILGFNERSLSNPTMDQWQVTKDGGVFDSFTGATITPRALTRAIALALSYHQIHHEALLLTFAQAPDSAISAESFIEN